MAGANYQAMFCSQDSDVAMYIGYDNVIFENDNAIFAIFFLLYQDY